MCRLTRAFSSFTMLAVLATCIACQAKPDASDPRPSETSAEALSASAAATPTASGALAKLEGSRTDVHNGATDIAERGDEATKRAAAPILVKRLRTMREPAYREELRPLIEKANAQSQLAPTPEQLAGQVQQFQEEEVIKLLRAAAKIGGPEISAYLVELTQEKEASPELRRAVIEALEPLRPSLDPTAVAAVDAAREALRPPSAGIAVGEASVAGGTVANAGAVVAGMAAGFRRCFRRGLQEDPTMKGTVRITAKIGKNGEVLAVTPSGGGTLSTTVVNCVAARVATAQFSPPEGGLATLVIPVSMTPE
jgi:hypothetical protein